MVVVGEVAAAVVVTAVVVVAGLGVTTTLSATAAGKCNDTFDDTTPDNRFPKARRFCRPFPLFSHLSSTDNGGALMYALSEHTDTPGVRSILTTLPGH